MRCAAYSADAWALGRGSRGSTICAGPMPSLPNRGCSSLPQPMQWPVNPLGGEPPTGEPYAGDPPVRFGGGSGRETGCSYPYTGGSPPRTTKIVSPSMSVPVKRRTPLRSRLSRPHSLGPVSPEFRGAKDNRFAWSVYWCYYSYRKKLITEELMETSTKFSEDIVPLSDMKINPGRIVNQVDKTRETGPLDEQRPRRRCSPVAQGLRNANRRAGISARCCPGAHGSRRGTENGSRGCKEASRIALNRCAGSIESPLPRPRSRILRQSAPGTWISRSLKWVSAWCRR